LRLPGIARASRPFGLHRETIRQAFGRARTRASLKSLTGKG